MWEIKKAIYSGVWLGLLASTNIKAYADFNADQGTKADPITKWWTLINTIETWINALLGLLLFVAVIYWLWWGFNILTAAWDEEKVKKWKTILMNAVIWIVVIFMVWLIVRFVINLVSNNDVNG